MSIEIEREGEALEAAHRKATFEAMPAGLVKLLRVGVTEVNGAVATAVGRSDSLQMNQIVGLGAAREPNEQAIERLLLPFRERRVKRVAVHLPPTTSGALRELLTRRSFVETGRRAVLARDVRAAPHVETSFRVSVIGTQQAREFAALYRTFGWANARDEWFAALVGRTGFHHFMAFDGDTPVATAALFVHERTGFLTWAATSTRHRKKGAQRALIAARIEKAASLGCSALYVTTAAPSSKTPGGSRRNLIASGFEPVYEQHVWLGS